MAGALGAQTWSGPAGTRPPLRRDGASILPGGRIIAPAGQEYVSGPGAFGLAVSPGGRYVVTANTGPGRNSLTVLERQRKGWDDRQILAAPPAGPGADESEPGGWQSVFMGLAFDRERGVYVSEGESGRVSLLDWEGQRRRSFDLNQDGYTASYTGDLAMDADRDILYVVDQANFRVAVIDLRTRHVVASVRVGRLPFAMALSPDRRRLYVTNLGMFEYQAIPGADAKQAAATGLPFPAFGFPSPEAEHGLERATARGTVKVPGLGDPNTHEANSVCVIDVSNPAAPQVEAFIRTGLPFGGQSDGGSSPSGVVAAADSVFVSNAADDSVTVIDARTHRIAAEIPIRIPGLESLRGVLPVGMAYDAASGWLLVAEAGINAIGVIDTRERRVIGHIPVAWFPTRVAIEGGTVFVANARGHGVGPDWEARVPPVALRTGSISIFPLPERTALTAMTERVMEVNGFVPQSRPAKALPKGIRYVVLIVKENRTYDEVLGDLPEGAGMPEIARLGTRGYVDGKRKRLSIKDTNITPNHHAMARRWAFSDNFYAD